LLTKKPDIGKPRVVTKPVQKNDSGPVRVGRASHNQKLTDSARSLPLKGLMTQIVGGDPVFEFSRPGMAIEHCHNKTAT
jgi:hypothetical protein